MNLRTETRRLSELVLEVGAVTVSAIIGLLLVSHAVHTGTAAKLESAPLVGPVIGGVQVAIDAIVTPPQG